MTKKTKEEDDFKSPKKIKKKEHSSSSLSTGGAATFDPTSWASPLAAKSGSRKTVVGKSSDKKDPAIDGGGDDSLFSPKKTKKKSSKDSSSKETKDGGKDSSSKETKTKSSSSSSSSAAVSSDRGSIALKDTPTIKKKKKKESDTGTTTAGDDDMSQVSTKSNKSTKSSKSTKSPRKKSKKSEGGDDDASVSSKKSKKGSGGGEGDEASVSSRRSVRSSTRSTRSHKDKTSSLQEHLDHGATAAPYSSHRRSLDDDLVTDWQAENEALQAETVTLRKQLTETLALLDKARASHNQADDITELELEIKRYKNDIAELQLEVEEYEEAVAEKDGLIKKLTEAVDCQLDKVEYLELKLQRAEEEFCKMEDELKEMEEEIEILKSDSKPASGSVSKNGDGMRSSNHSVSSTGSLKEVAEDMERRLMEDKRKRLEQREIDLEQREAELYDREQELLDREHAISDREHDLLDKAEARLGAEMDQIRLKELRLKERERELLELEDRLNAEKVAQEEKQRSLLLKIQEQEQKAAKQAEQEVLERSLGIIEVDVPEMTQPPEVAPEAIAELETRIEKLEKENSELENTVREQKVHQDDANETIMELKERVKAYQVEIAEVQEANEDLKRADSARRAQDFERDAQNSMLLQTIQEGNNKQIQELYEENRMLQAENSVLKEQMDALKKSIPDDGVDPTDHAMAGLQDEIAGLREKIVEKERESKMLRDEIDTLRAAVEDHGSDTKELDAEILRLETQLKETKASITKKMAQKDETISFMQNEMVRIMKEKSAVDKKLHETEIQLKAKANNRGGNWLNSKDNEEQERAKLQVFYDQIAALDAENQDLRGELEQTRLQHQIQLKAKDARILEVEEEIADLNWEMKARKEADYVTLLKDRKERKKELDAAKKDLKVAKERVDDLERELEELRRNQEYLEKDVTELNKSLVARDSGDYVSGLKRQIRSLKEHNMTLERKLEVEIANTKDVLEKKDAKISSLEADIRDLKYPTQAAVRGMFGFANRGDKNKDKTTDADTTNEESKISVVTETQEQRPSGSEEGISEAEKSSVSVGPSSPAPLQPPKPSLWSAIISPFGGSRRNIPIAALAISADRSDSLLTTTGGDIDEKEGHDSRPSKDNREWKVDSMEPDSTVATTLDRLDECVENSTFENSDRESAEFSGEQLRPPNDDTQKAESPIVQNSAISTDGEDSNPERSESAFSNNGIIPKSETAEDTDELEQIHDDEISYDELKSSPVVETTPVDDDSLETADDIDTDEDVALVNTDNRETRDEPFEEIESEHDKSDVQKKEIVFV